MDISKTSQAFADARLAYSLLEDEQSRNIFRNRVLLNSTGDGKFALDLNPRFSEEFRNGIMDWVKKTNKLDAIIYGAGFYGEFIFYRFSSVGMQPKFFWDINEQKQKSGFCGIPVLPPPDKIEPDEIIFVALLNADTAAQVCETLVERGARKENIFRYTDYLADRENQYFDSEIIKFGENEVFIDGGVLDFETSLNFLRRCSNAKKIYAFEPSPNTAGIARRVIAQNGISNVVLIEKGLWSS